ncbi:MAG: hypothetical protein ABJK64_08695 [Paraglaciecola sp.]|uniref:hypothetical protein n=1 Tax=Paraglaciecola sp. TaxID=1920173 RepID=UPI0032982DAF
MRLLKAQVDESQQTLVDSMLLGTAPNELLHFFIEPKKDEPDKEHNKNSHS